LAQGSNSLWFVLRRIVCFPLHMEAKSQEVRQLLKSAEKFYDECEYGQTLQEATTALALSREIEDKEGIADSALWASRAYAEKSQREEAANLASQELSAFRDAGDSQGEAKMLLAMAIANSDERGKTKREEALQAAMDARELFQKLDDKKFEAQSLMQIVCIHLTRTADKMQGALDAQQVANEALELSSAAGDRKGQGYALHMLGAVGVLIAFLRQGYDLFSIPGVQIDFLQPGFRGMTVHLEESFADGIQAAEDALAIWQDLKIRQWETFELQSIARWQLAAHRPQDSKPNAEEAVIAAKAPGGTLEATALVCVMEGHIAQRELGLALEKGEEGLARFKETGDKRSQMCIMTALARVHEGQGLPEQAMSVCQEALSLSRDLADSANEMKLLLLLAELHKGQNQFQKAAQMAFQSAKLCQQEGEHKQQAHALHQASVAFSMDGEYEAAVQAAGEALAISRQADYKMGEGVCLLGMCSAYRDQGDSGMAVKTALEAQTLFNDQEEPLYEAEAFLMVAVGQMDQQYYPAALEAAKSARSLLKGCFSYNEFQALLLIAQLETLLISDVQNPPTRGTRLFHEAFDKALKAANNAVVLSRRMKSKPLIASALHTLAEVYSLDRRGREALKAAKEAVLLFREDGEQRDEASSLIVCSEAQFMLGAKQKAIEVANSALELFRQIGDQAGEMKAMNALERLQPRATGMLPDSPVTQESQIVPKRESSKVADIQSIAAKIKVAAENLVGLDEEIDLDAPLMQSGLTSNAVVLLRNELTKEFPSANMPYTLVFDYPSVNAITNFMAWQSGD